MSVTREGGCARGAVRYRLSSEPLITHCCHCLNCQRQTGSAFVINLLIEADRVEQPVRGGTLDEPSSVEPSIHIYTKSKLPWVSIPEGAPAVAEFYDVPSVWPGASLERVRAAG